jgi:hypothetical protein
LAIIFWCKVDYCFPIKSYVLPKFIWRSRPSISLFNRTIIIHMKTSVSHRLNILCIMFKIIAFFKTTLNSIRGSDWYITIMVWKFYNGKIEVISFMSFVTGSCRKLTISVKFEVHINKWDRGGCFCCFCCLYYFELGYNNVTKDIKEMTSILPL